MENQADSGIRLHFGWMFPKGERERIMALLCTISDRGGMR